MLCRDVGISVGIAQGQCVGRRPALDPVLSLSASGGLVWAGAAGLVWVPLAVGPAEPSSYLGLSGPCAQDSSSRCYTGQHLGTWEGPSGTDSLGCVQRRSGFLSLLCAGTAQPAFSALD